MAEYEHVTVQARHGIRDILILIFSLHTLPTRQVYSLSLDNGEDIRVTSVSDGHNGNTVESTARGTKVNVVTVEVMDISLSQHCIVLELRSAKSRAVGRNEQQLGLTSAKSLERALETKSVLARLDNKLQLA